MTSGLTLYMTECLQKVEKTLGLSDELCGILGLVMCLRTLWKPGVSAMTRRSNTRSMGTISTGKSSFQRPTQLRAHTKAATGKARRKGTAKGLTAQCVEREPARLLGIIFGLDATVYSCIRAQGASSLRRHTLKGDQKPSLGSEKVCTLLADLLNRWPNAYSDEDLKSEYAKKLIDPLFPWPRK